MDKSHNRIIVASSLRKIEEGTEVEESVKAIDDVLRELAKSADQTQSYLQTREQGGFLETELNVQDLETVGMYRTTRKFSKTQKTVSFSREGIAIEFQYTRRKDYTFTKGLISANLEEVAQSVDAGTLAQAAMLTMFTGKDIGLHHRELELGKEARTLDPYVLEKVEVVKTAPLKVFGINIPFIPAEKREEVYSVQN